MDAFKISGGYPLKGVFQVNGSKNASLPCLYASLLTPQPIKLKRVPKLRDTKTASQLLEFLGKRCSWQGGTVTIEERGSIQKRSVAQAPYELVRQMRASVLSAGPLLARFGKTLVALPGGCAIGMRPINIHLDGFKAMGASIDAARRDLLISAPRTGLRPVRFRLAFPSVG